MGRPFRTASILLALAIAVACSPVAEPPSTASPTSSGTARPSQSGTIVATGDVVMTTVARPAVQQDDAQRAAAGVRSLAVDLYRQLAMRQTNLVFSPYSVAVALAMTRIGAKGETARQMDLVLHASTVGDLDGAFNSLDQILAKRPGSYPYGFGPAGQNTVPLELATANRLWAQRDYTFATPFLDRLSAYYGAGVGIVDYIAARETARKAINDWVSDRTKTRIPELIKQGVLNELTRFVLTNAIYMKAKWTDPFDAKLTAGAPFHRLDGSTTQASLMRSRLTSMLYGSSGGVQAVRLEYVGGLSMIVVVPDAGTFSAFESTLDTQRLDSITASMKPRWVDLQLPKFQFRTASPLREALGKMGMPIAFTDGADFSGISPVEKLVLQDVVHEAFIAVDEEGTEAAAATAVIGGATAGPSDVVALTVDRPFVFLVRDEQTGAILFMGRVLDPS